MGTKRGQALTELMVGLFSLTLIVAVLCSFTIGIVRSLEEQNELRVREQDSADGKWKIEDKVDLGDLWKVF